MHGAAVVVGVGESTYYKRGGSPDSEFQLACTAIRRAVEDAGLPVKQVDGIGSFMVLNDSVSCGALGTALGLPELRWTMEFQHGGQSPCHVVGLAAMAVACGYAENVVVFRALNGRSGVRVGSVDRAQVDPDTFQAVVGLTLRDDIKIPKEAISRQIAESVDLIVQVKRLCDGSRRTTNITEVIGPTFAESRIKILSWTVSNAL